MKCMQLCKGKGLRPRQRKGREKEAEETTEDGSERSSQRTKKGQLLHIRTEREG